MQEAVSSPTRRGGCYLLVKFSRQDHLEDLRRHGSAAAFPIGTLVVNTLACLAVGFLGAALAGPLLIREEYRVALLVGLLGGFSTFSTYGLETFSLLGDGQKWRAGANVLLSNGLGLGAVWIGYRLAERIYGP